MATINEPSNISSSSNDSLWVKRFFLNFLQAYFAEHTKYTWSLGVNSKIIIVDKYAMDLAQTAKKPSIVVSRGYMRWTQSSMGQYYSRGILSKNSVFTDLVSGSITINCIAKNGIVCEELALTVRNILTGYRHMLRKNGIHSIDSIVVDEERNLSTDSEITLTVVPVTVQFTKQTSLAFSEDFYSTNLKINFSGIAYGAYSGMVLADLALPLQLYENIHYTAWASGIVFVSGYAPPTGATLALNYLEAATLQNIDEVPTGIVNGSNPYFGTSYKIYGDYPLLGSYEYVLPSNSGVV